MCVVRLIKNLEILLMVSMLQFVTGTRTLHLIYDLFVLSDLLNLDCFFPVTPMSSVGLCLDIQLTLR